MSKQINNRQKRVVKARQSIQKFVEQQVRFQKTGIGRRRKVNYPRVGPKKA